MAGVQAPLVFHKPVLQEEGENNWNRDKDVKTPYYSHVGPSTALFDEA